MPLINDEYRYPHPYKPRKLVSRQRVHQIMNQRNGKCQRCGRAYTGKGLCHRCCPRRRSA